MSVLDHDLSKLTRKSLEITFKVQRMKLEAEEIKIGQVKDRIKVLIKDVKDCHGTSYEFKEVSGRLKALHFYLNENPHNQFPEASELVNSKGLIEVQVKPQIWPMLLSFSFGILGTSLVSLILRWIL